MEDVNFKLNKDDVEVICNLLCENDDIDTSDSNLTDMFVVMVKSENDFYVHEDVPEEDEEVDDYIVNLNVEIPTIDEL